jgi:hypothetical protein
MIIVPGSTSSYETHDPQLKRPKWIPAPCTQSVPQDPNNSDVLHDPVECSHLWFVPDGRTQGFVSRDVRNSKCISGVSGMFTL